MNDGRQWNFIKLTVRYPIFPHRGPCVGSQLPSFGESLDNFRRVSASSDVRQILIQELTYVKSPSRMRLEY